MRITHYYQSCLLVEEGDSRIALDVSVADADIEKFGKLDAVLYTHEHADHFDAEVAQKFMDGGVAVYANASTAKQMKTQPNIVDDGHEFKVKDLALKAIELPHCLMIDGSDGPQNTGYLIGGKLFDPGDGKELEGLKVENLALPIIGPDISFKDVFDFAKQTDAKKLIPIHYDTMGAKPELLKKFCEWFNLPYGIIVLSIGESAEV